MKDVVGDLWTYPAEVRAITTNGFVKSNGAAVMGRGCAQQARDRYPGLDFILGELIRTHGNRCFRITNARFSRPVLSEPILTFPVKPVSGPNGEPGWLCEADLGIIATSARQAVEIADRFGWSRIVLPRPGSGNGRLRYADVRDVIAPILDNRFSVITFDR